MSDKLPSFSIRVPLLALLCCYVALASLTTVSYLNLRQTESDGADVCCRAPDRRPALARNHFLLASVTGSGAIASRTVQAINFPAMATEMVASVVMRSWPNSWRPKAISDLFIWRSLIFPVYCLPFWWFAGMGIDAFRGRRCHWTLFLSGTVLVAFFAFLGVGLAITAEERNYEDMAFVFSGFAIWVPLLTLYPITWARTFLRLRRNRRANVEG